MKIIVKPHPNRVSLRLNSTWCSPKWWTRNSYRCCTNAPFWKVGYKAFMALCYFDLGFSLSAKIPRVSGESFTDCEWDGVYPIRFSWKRSRFGPVTAAVTPVYQSCCGLPVFLVLKWHRRKSFCSLFLLLLKASFSFFIFSPHGITSALLMSSPAHLWPLSLFLSLQAAAEDVRTIEATECAWQNYWAVQPRRRWHSPLKSLPRSLACWIQIKILLAQKMLWL